METCIVKTQPFTLTALLPRPGLDLGEPSRLTVPGTLVRTPGLVIGLTLCVLVDFGTTVDPKVDEGTRLFVHRY